MKITEIRILPPFAVARLGSSPTPVAAYDLEIPVDKPLGFRKIVPQPTFYVDPNSHELSVDTPAEIIFKDAQSTTDTTGTIRPVAPFLEVFAITADKPDVLVPLTQELLESAGFQLSDITWYTELYNSKIMRRTNDPNDNITASFFTNNFEPVALMADCPNFLSGKKLRLGTMQFIKPSKEFPQIRLRYTPGAGKVYGSSLNSIKAAGQEPTPDPNIKSESDVLYDPTKPWASYSESPNFNPNYTMPAQIFAGYSDKEGNQHSWGYIDDECDGIFVVKITKEGSQTALTASAHVCAGPPAFAPDILPIRAISDELEQILLGTERDDVVPIEEAEDIVRRAFESITLMNTNVMNGNPINGRWNVASTMVRQDTNDFGRLYEPIMASSIVDNLALQSLHERVFNGLSTGMAAWFADALRRPDKIGDLSDKERRKMPGLMRGADGRGLALTYRMINTVIQAAANAMFEDNNVNAPTPANGDTIKANDFSAQIHHRGQGNPYSVLSRAAISNCFPGLESDFRNLWRYLFTGLLISENDNYVLQDTTINNLTGRRIVGINGKPTMVMGEGPVFPGGDSVPLRTKDNPNGAAFMEWSNFIASLGIKGGDTVTLQFTPGVADLPVLVTAEQLKDTSAFPALPFGVSQIFVPNTAAISPAILRPGELTQGLCAPWQNDYRECACYYWAATRPDYVNVVPGENGLSKGDMWLAKRRTGEYVPDNRVDSRLFSYNDLFQNWEGELNFIINGRDALSSGIATGSGDQAGIAGKAVVKQATNKAAGNGSNGNATGKKEATTKNKNKQ